MKNFVKKLLIILVLMLSVYALVACDASDLPLNQDDVSGSDMEKVISALSGVKITYAEGDTEATITKDITLPTSVGECSIEWKSSDTSVITNDGKVTRASEDKTVKLTVTVSLNEEKLSKSFNVTVKAKGSSDEDPTETTPIASILALVVVEGETTTETYVVKGTITEIQNAIYGNVVISDGTNSLLVFGIFDANGKKYNELEDKPEVGDTITVQGPVKNYAGTNELFNSTLIKLENGDSPVTPGEEDDIEATIAEVLALQIESKTTNKYIVVGTVKEIQNETFGNILITDGENDLLVYGLYDEAGNRYDAMETQLAVGDVITVVGPAQKYLQTYELVDAVLLDVEEGDDPIIDIEIVDISIEDLLKVEIAENVITEIYYCVEGKITLVSDSTFGNVYITDGTNSIYIYGLYDEEGNRFDAMETLPKAGDTITVIGQLKNFKGTLELISAVLAELEEGEPEETPTKTIAEALALGAASVVKVEGTVIAKHSKGFVVQDDTAAILVYMNYTAFNYAVGDKLSIEGGLTQYHNRNQFDNKATITVLSHADYTHPDPVVLDGTGVNNEIANSTMGKYVQIEGTLILEDTYYNLTIEGIENKVAITYPTADLTLGLYVDKKVTLSGYVLDVNEDGNMLNVLGVKVECEETITGEKLPQEYNFNMGVGSSTELAKGWTWAKINSKGTYATGYQSFRNNGEAITSPIFEAEGDGIKVYMHYYLQSVSTGTSTLTIKAYKADGTLVTEVTTENINTGEKDIDKNNNPTAFRELNLTIDGEDIAYITIVNNKNKGCNIGFDIIKIENK